MSSTYDTQTIRRKDIDHQIHPWTDFATFKDAGSLVLADAEGAFVVDSDGNRYLDGIGGLWCVNVGYGRKEIAEAMAAQAEKMVYYSSFGAHTSIPAAELAHKLAALAPRGLSHIQFGTGGSMANDTAVRMIHYYFNRLGQKSKKKIITRHDGYQPPRPKVQEENHHPARRLPRQHLPVHVADRRGVRPSRLRHHRRRFDSTRRSAQYLPPAARHVGVRILR